MNMKRAIVLRSTKDILKSRFQKRSTFATLSQHRTNVNDLKVENKTISPWQNVTSKRSFSIFTQFGGARNSAFLSKRGIVAKQAIETQTRLLFIQTESTPNPESIKFLPGRDVLTEEQAEDNKGFYATATDKEEIARSPLAKELFKVDGVKSVYLGRDFVTVTKYATAHWSHLRTLIFGVIMDFYSAESPLPALADAAIITDTTIFDDDDEVVAMIKELLETRIRPAVQEDGGDIRYIGYEEETGIVSVKLAGSCVGCPSSAVTLRNGVENMLMHYIPEITAVHAMEEDDEGNMVDSTTGAAIEEPPKKAKTYEERLAAAGIPFSD